MSAGKGSVDRGSPEKRRGSALWCEVCGNMRGASCVCKLDVRRVESWKECSPLPRGPILDQLSVACGYELRERAKDASTCAGCGKVLRVDDTVAYGGSHGAMCIQCYFKRDK